MKIELVRNAFKTPSIVENYSGLAPFKYGSVEIN
jgi:hypothetical protein